MPNFTLVVLTAFSYSIAFYSLAEKVLKLSELREEVDLSLQVYAKRWPVEKETIENNSRSKII